MNSNQRLRARFIFGLVVIAAGFLASSLYWTQIVRGESYAAKAGAQYVKPPTAVFDRGSIYFSSKDGTKAAAATDGKGAVLFMNPSLVVNVDEAYNAISEYVKLDKAEFKAKAAKPNDHYELLAEKLDTATAASLKALRIAGLGVSSAAWRTYPGGSLASHIVGLVGEHADSSELVGRYGLERFYEQVLSRSSPASSINVFAQLFGNSASTSSAMSGKEGGVITTIEPTVEQYLEKVLNDTEAKWHSDEIGGIIIDPNTGEIAAMSSIPTFDPNDISGLKDVSILSNPLVEHVYEMGSIMKPLTMAMALDTGVVTPTSTYDDTGTMTLNGKKIANFDGRARGVIPMQEILSQSLNIGAATIAMKTEHEIGTGTVYTYMSSYGLGQKTGVDEPNEATGLISNLKSGRDIEIATGAYGQGIAVSPIEMVRALSVLASGGSLITPHVVKEIDYTDGTTLMISPSMGARVLKKQTTDEVTAMLTKVVDDVVAKAHPDIHFDHYSIAAKTGTAQIPDHVSGGYYPDRYLHSFFGYFPARNPKFLVFLYQIYPKGAEYASETLTDPFSEIAKFLINYYSITPDR